MIGQLKIEENWNEVSTGRSDRPAASSASGTVSSQRSDDDERDPVATDEGPSSTGAATVY